MAKVCSKCKVEQPEADFSKRRNTPDGLQHVCKDCNSVYSKTYWKAHKEQLHKRHKLYRSKHKESVLQRTKVWLVNNKDRKRETDAIWRKNHPDVTKCICQTRRARKAGLARTLTSAQWKHILDEFNNTCAYCGEEKPLHQEHFVPVLSGGEYTHDNIIPSCGSCNTSKGAKDFFAWYSKFSCYDKQREKKLLRFLHYTGGAQQLTFWTAREKR